MVNSHAYRETRAIFNHFPKRELFYSDAASLKDIIDRMVFMSSDDEIAVSVRTASGYDAVRIAFSDLRYSNRASRTSATCLTEAFGPVAFNKSADWARRVLIFYFNTKTLEHPIDIGRVREIIVGDLDMGGPGRDDA